MSLDVIAAAGLGAKLWALGPPNPYIFGLEVQYNP
jgi:hypothetical protein